MESIIFFIIAVAIGVFILKVLFKVTGSIIGFLINSLVGAIVIGVLNIFGLGIPITWLTSIIVGMFGVAGVLIVLILKFVFKII